MRLLILIIMAGSILVCPGCSRNKEGDNYVYVESDDTAMNAAIAQAQATSADFVRAFHEQKPGTKEFYVKKPYLTPSGDAEHMWIEVLKETHGILDGVIANEAESTRLVKIGQAVSFNISDISDWKYVDGRKLVGGYTIRYFYEKMSPEEKKDFVKQVGFEF
ncbi:MAG TPA: DUF2314 domain-containing protein [Candidatus Omnitrophota bacterium]|nr:DUF2314 domain-containing protein [Candidatus Omnitrophota bacterium]HPB68508.1 DUF2314 domain-containing protein [Candidatus Omnitrophota bacterium]HQO58213.1 DUF2314 domain-containing protein [Candidatus Omnitrophota bacterium]HQP11198.1 DUF2314 domain-containing protein [Candidatus Omnitrophota bacterium]